MKNLLLTTLLSMTLVLGISSHVRADNTDSRAIVEKANATWNQALNSGNSAALAKLYLSNAILSPGNGQTLAGRDAIENLFKGFVDNGVHNHTLEIVEVGGNGKMIYQVAKWNANGAEADGKVPSFGGITTSVLEKGTDGKWYIRSHVWNVAN
jgi:uncharacterized protein (TIGR02246 family)